MAARQQAPVHAVLAEDAFRHAVGRERLLADRHRRRFSIAIFRLPATAFRPASDPRVVAVVARHARISDDVGWLGRSGIGVLLRETPAAGAEAFCARVAADLAEIGADAAWRTLCYPHASAPPSGMTGSRPSSPPDPGTPPGSSLADPMSGRDDETGDVQWVVARPFPRWKRLLDIAVAAVAIVVSAPVIAAAGALIKLASPGPVFFGQERVGRLGRRFTCWKLRTMRVNADDDAHRRHVNALIRSAEGMAKLDANRDPRVFLVGRFLRAWCVDELPQLYNVLRGDMSLIGPRPCIPYEYEQYQDWHRQRCEAMPGLTGLWQVSGKNRLSFSQMVRMDIAYARGLTPALDVKILLRTLPAIWAQARDLAHIADPTRHRPAVAARSV